MLAERRRLWAEVVQMLYKCFMYAGLCVDPPIIMALQMLFIAHCVPLYKYKHMTSSK